MIEIYPAHTDPKSDILSILDDMKITGTDRIEFFSRRRNAWVIEKRIFVVRKMRSFGYSYPAIGNVMDRHHTSIMNLDRPKFAKSGAAVAL